MSTYNGERYIREQLDSIYSQKNVNIHLLVRDDGSYDSTISILERYKEDHPDSMDIIKGENMGWKMSFFTLAKIANAQFTDFNYFAFSDQDDIWMPDKLITAVTMIKEINDRPALYCSNLTYYKDGIQSGNIKSESIIISPENCLIRNMATGCTIVFNRQLLGLASKEIPNTDIAHDYWLYLVGCTCGCIIYDKDSHILYRQHENSQIGFKHGFYQIWKRRLKSISSLLASQNKDLLAGELLRIHGDSMHSYAKNATTKLRDYRKSISKKTALLLDNRYSYQNKSNDIWLKLRIIFGRL